jgi:hypothetical protein
MRRFMGHLVTEVEFEDGDEASDDAVRNYRKHLHRLEPPRLSALLQRLRQLLCTFCSCRPIMPQDNRGQVDADLVALCAQRDPRQGPG